MEIQVVSHAHLAAGTAGYARRKIAHLAHYSREPVSLARLTFTVIGNRGVHRHVRVRAHLDVDGRPLVAQAEAGTAREAVDVLDARLRRRLLRMNPHWEARRGRTYRPDRALPARPPNRSRVPGPDEGPAAARP
jgi:ribosome-associated translation inhibitor RaiA